MEISKPPSHLIKFKDIVNFLCIYLHLPVLALLLHYECMYMQKPNRLLLTGVNGFDVLGGLYDKATLNKTNICVTNNRTLLHLKTCNARFQTEFLILQFDNT